MNQPETIEEELAIIAEALEAGIDPFPLLRRKSQDGLERVLDGS